MLPERKPQILVVDDELNLRRVLSVQLMRDGYDVHVAVDGEDGLGLLREHHIDLAITDLRMPRLDGITATARIKSCWPCVRVVVHSLAVNEHTPTAGRRPH